MSENILFTISVVQFHILCNLVCNVFQNELFLPFWIVNYLGFNERSTPVVKEERILSLPIFRRQNLTVTSNFLLTFHIRLLNILVG